MDVSSGTRQGTAKRLLLLLLFVYGVRYSMLVIGITNSSTRLLTFLFQDTQELLDASLCQKCSAAYLTPGGERAYMERSDNVTDTLKLLIDIY